MLLNRDIVVVEHIVKPLIGNPFFIVKKFLNCKEITNEPMPLSVIGLYMIDTENKSNHLCIQIDEIKHKCLFVQMSNISAIVSTLCHCE